MSTRTLLFHDHASRLKGKAYLNIEDYQLKISVTIYALVNFALRLKQHLISRKGTALNETEMYSGDCFAILILKITCRFANLGFA